jgi:hypothetical protein
MFSIDIIKEDCLNGYKTMKMHSQNSLYVVKQQSPGTSKKTVLALINELQVQDSAGSDEEIGAVSSSKSALVRKLAQMPPEIWMTLSLEAKKWLLNERKRQQQEEDKSKKSSDTNDNDAFKMSESNNNTSSKLPNQYAKVKNAVKGEEEVQDDIDHNYGFVDEFLEKAWSTSNIYEAQQDTDYDFWSSDHNVHTSISINNTLYKKCMNLLFLQENHHISILDGCADTCALGKGCKVLSIHSSRRANVVGFDHETAIKWNLPIVSAITAIDLPSGQSILLVIHEGIYNETAAHSLLSEFNLREFGINIDSTCHRHGGTQQMTIKGDSDRDSDVLTIPLDLAGCMVHFKHRLPTAEEIASLKQYCLTQGDVPWNPSSFSDQMADKIYQQVIETENYNIRLGFTSKDPLVTVVDKVSQHNHLKMPFFDPADLHMNNVNGKPAHLVFHVDSVQKNNVEDSVLVNIDPHFSKALPTRIDYESLSPYFAFRPHDVIQLTLKQTTQLAK